MRQAGWPRLGKLVMDRSLAALGLVASAPLLGAAAVAVRVRMGGPVFFSQERPGLDGRPFRIFKMRTMTNERDAEGRLLPDEQRLTPLGKALRASSIDELPQLWNVLCGQLSLVGPRPLLMSYLSLYSPEQARRHDVMPGITGWAQVNGRNQRSWDDKLALDVWYVDNWSLLLDLRILARTIATVAQRSGIASDGHVTMPEFTGPTPR